MKRIILSVMALLLVLGIASTSFAQGNQAGIIRGTVKDQQGLPVPNVKVTVTSASLQGPRSTTSNGQGAFVLRPLPAGDYHIVFELTGFATVNVDANLPLGLTLTQDVTLNAGAVAEQVEVVTQTPPPITNPVVGMNFRHDDLAVLPTPRTIQGIAQLSPAVNEASPNSGQLVINGSFAFDSVFMINGVDINDNLFATPQNLFIEDAIDETQVLTSGISAEFGRFSGGVVNAITKSGGNTFSGSGRINFTNPAWTTGTPFEVTKNTAHLDQTGRSYEGTFGGPILKDKVWFFVSGRHAETPGQVTLVETGIGLPALDTNNRGEIKGTVTPYNGHTFQVGFLNDPRTRTNNSGLQSFIMDPHSEVDRTNPNHYTYYRGALQNNILVEAQYSDRHFKFQEGGTSTNIQDSPIFSVTQCACVYNAPYFDFSDPEERNNRQLTASVTNYWNLHGRHETKSGYEWFRSQRTGGNSQSSTLYVFNTDFLTDANGNPALDANGYVIPVFNADGNTTVDFFPAARGGVMNVDNNSLYVQDHWTINGRWSADLGARYEHVKVLSTPGDIQSIDSNRIVPRFAVAWDVKGNGNQVVHLTYGQYSGRYNEAQIGANSPVGNPSDINFTYTGPSGQGRTFAPGFNLVNYPVNTGFVFSAPTANVIMDPSLKTPLTHEFTVSFGQNIRNGKGFGEVAYIHRVTHNLVEDFQDTTTGVSHVLVSNTDPNAGNPSTDPNAPAFTNRLYTNTNIAHRAYDALVFTSRYRISNNWTVNGHYTLELKNDGNYGGEGSNTPGSTVFSNSPSIIGNFPEAFNATRNYPDGRLSSFQRSRFRVWSAYNMKVVGGDFSVAGLWRVESGLTYSLASRNLALTSTQVALMTKAGYPDAASLVGSVSGNDPFYNGTLGSENFNGFGLFDLDLHYEIPVFKNVRPWIKFDVYNLFDNNKLIAYNTTVSQDPNTPTDNLGLRTGFVKGGTFGTATGNTQTNLFTNGIQTFPLAFTGAPAGGRTIRLAIGFRF